MCETCWVNGRHAKNMLNIKLSQHGLVTLLLLESSGEISRNSVESAYLLSSAKIDVLLLKSMRDVRL